VSASRRWSSLLDTGVRLIAMDYQNADENVLKLIAWVAEVERKLISKRIKAGLE
jgi:DNA invertase Pin-like site-specific DNA recombinase